MIEPTGIWLGVFLAVVAFCLVSVVAAIGWTATPGHRVRDTSLAIAAVVGWLGLTALPVMVGLVSVDQPLPGLPLMVGSMFALAGWAAWSSRGRRIAHELPLWILVGVQGMRFPLELVLHGWAEQGVVPPQMTWTGQNVDIVAGLVALGLAPFADRSRMAAWVSQVVGIVLLANVLRIVALSLPTPLQLFDEPLLMPFMLPSLWIAPVCVTFAITVHLLTVRRLLGR